MPTSCWTTAAGSRVVEVAGRVDDGEVRELHRRLRSYRADGKIVLDLSHADLAYLLFRSMLLGIIVGTHGRAARTGGSFLLVGSPFSAWGLPELEGLFATRPSLAAALADEDGPDDGLTGVREPRRPLPHSPQAAAPLPEIDDYE